MMEKLLLHVDYKSRKEGIELPWANIAHRLNPGSGGGSVKQYLHRLRRTLISEGHIVPPSPMNSKTITPPGPPRGLVRDISQTYPYVTRQVSWEEPLRDPKESLVVPGVIRGSRTWARQRYNQQQKPEPTQSPAPILPKCSGPGQANTVIKPDPDSVAITHLESHETRIPGTEHTKTTGDLILAIKLEDRVE